MSGLWISTLSVSSSLKDFNVDISKAENKMSVVTSHAIEAGRAAEDKKQKALGHCHPPLY